ncbi:amidohydrolase 3 [Periconia macrospinosa]|uniref:Amidohydrolase 3 n=1 Tax=Periconia macrospinosa TaxID=97972 RepID=A0A2V1DY40_9PLEO|nr:amidohydrolase 3 [Periconia macrospinosa]
MPSIGVVVLLSSLITLVAVIYQNPGPYLTPILASLPFAIPQFFEQIYCYNAVKTNSESLPHAECFSVKNGHFKRVFSAESDIVREARTGHVIPGLWDGHGHLLQLGELKNSVDLFGASSMSEVHERLISYKSLHKTAGNSEEWLRGVGWDQAVFGQWPVASDLEFGSEFKDLYVMLDRIDVHCIWVSEKVLSLLPNPLPEIPGGEIPAKGVFCDNAMDIVLQHYPEPSSERKTKFIKDAMRELNKFGIVGMHDAGVTPKHLKLYGTLSQKEEWSVRVYAMLECEVRNTFCPEKAIEVASSNDKFYMRSVKLFADGALGSWGSAMIEPYSDKETSSGSLLVNATTLTRLAREWSGAGYQVNIHAIGDLANRLAVNAFEEALGNLCPDASLHECQSKHRFRIEHAQIIHPDDQHRISQIGIIPSIQPTHATSDMYYAESRLGKDRTLKEAYRMRSLLPLNPVFGSDFPVEPANVFEGIYAAVTRRSPKTGLDPAGGTDGWYASETVTVQEALKGFTLNPAFAAFLEDKAGKIEPGAYADWVVLDKPLEAFDMESLRKANVKETWVGGKRVYHRPGPEDLAT